MEKEIDIHEPILTIGTVAKMLDIAVQTVRLYEQEGLVLPYRTESGRRMFSMHEVERLRCVRKMITENGLNLQGIKRMFSLLPCWEFKGGLDEECRNCPAYYEAEGPCWSIRHVGEKCQAVDCRECPVYRMQLNCQKLKEVIFGHRRPTEPLPREQDNGNKYSLD
ncbi:MAG: MerR family transcriptional regulator [Calditrichaeota bacterium]|nr:MAG: MerR family transcriptional regulator [Calditrichota bacterium]